MKPLNYENRIIDLLDDNPELKDQPGKVASRIGCHIDTARRHISTWQLYSEMDWVMDRVTTTRGCSTCENEEECRYLAALELPVLCEQVTAADLELAELHGLGDILRMSRNGGNHS